MPNLVVETKSIEMHVGNFPTVTSYMLCDNGSEQYIHLMEVNHEKDLGVWICSDLKPSLHCCKVAVSAGFIYD